MEAEPAPPGDAPGAPEANPDLAMGSAHPAPAAPDVYDPFAGADGAPPADGAAMGGESAQAGFVYDAASGGLARTQQPLAYAPLLSRTPGVNFLTHF